MGPQDLEKQCGIRVQSRGQTFLGHFPFWRPLSVSVTDDDVVKLRQNIIYAARQQYYYCTLPVCSFTVQ